MRLTGKVKRLLPKQIYDGFVSLGIEKILLDIYRKKAGRSIVKNYINSTDPEKREVAEWIKENGLTTFPYSYKFKYDWKTIDVYHDDDGYPYVLHLGKKLFFRKDMTNDSVKKLYVEMRAEQDIESPHCYVQKKDHEPTNGCIIAEIGAMEASFTLEWIERCKKAYLFECESAWMEPLRRTFAPWSDRVEVISKYVGSGGSKDETVQLDDFFHNKEVTLIKADIEGAEIDMLDGGEKTFSTKIKQAYICTYHRWNHPELIKQKLEAYGLQTEFNRRYMFLVTSPSEFEKCTWRRGIIYAERID